ncbi:spore coat protein YlbD [Alkalibacillus sp. S2W]|uniref:spore coat protein YlbD n=1 Tax=Alkalibacillus sp. S2W TaxID=3386553 RepID=UPI00398CB85B
MSPVHLPPELHQFKQFVETRPELINLVRQGQYTWQTLFNLWKEKGEEEGFWKQFGATKTETRQSNSDYIQNVLKKISEIDIDQVEKNVNQLMGALAQIEHLSDQFKQMKKGPDKKRFPF